jgi:hypothetical protein
MMEPAVLLWRDRFAADAKTATRAGLHFHEDDLTGILTKGISGDQIDLAFIAAPITLNHY